VVKKVREGRCGVYGVVATTTWGLVDRGGCGHARVSFWDLSNRWLQRPERVFSDRMFEWGVVWSRIAWLLERSRPFPL